MTERVQNMQDVYDLIIATCQDDPEFHSWGASALRYLNRRERDSDAARSAETACRARVAKDQQARADKHRPKGVA